MDRVAIEEIVKKHGCQDFRWISGSDIVVQQWVRMKCTFGCDSYGKKATCPPEVPSIAECREFFREYDHVLVMRIVAKMDHPDDRRDWSRKKNLSLLPIEKEVFLAGYQKAFLTFMDECRLCQVCTGKREACLIPEKARPGPESLGVDVFATVRQAGFPIEVLTDYDQAMNRYSFLLVELIC